MDEFYDIPRSHQDPKAIIDGRHCYTNAAPSQLQEGNGNKSLVFTYDFDNPRQNITANPDQVFMSILMNRLYCELILNNNINI